MFLPREEYYRLLGYQQLYFDKVESATAMEKEYQAAVKRLNTIESDHKAELEQVRTSCQNELLEWKRKYADELQKRLNLLQAQKT